MGGLFRFSVVGRCVVIGERWQEIFAALRKFLVEPVHKYAPVGRVLHTHNDSCQILAKLSVAKIFGQP